MTQEEENMQLKEQLREVLEQLGAVTEHLSQMQERESQLLERLSTQQAEKHTLQESLAAAQKRIGELEKQKTPPPAFVKANVKKPQEGEKQARQKREPSRQIRQYGCQRPLFLRVWLAEVRAGAVSTNVA